MGTALVAFRLHSSRHSVIDRDRVLFLCHKSLDESSDWHSLLPPISEVVSAFSRDRLVCVCVCVCESTLIRVVLLVDCVSRDEVSGKNKSFVVTLEARR